MKTEWLNISTGLLIKIVIFMKKQSAIIIICSVLLLLISGCGAKYDKERFLGKTSDEIIEESGPFDCITAPADDDGLFRSCRCGYTLKKPQKGFFGTSPEVLFFITFDENGTAVACGKDFRPGG